MVYLLHKYFGRDGREEGEALLERRSGEQDNPRILQAFNEKTPDWLSFFMFTYFTDRVKARLGLDHAQSNVLEIVGGRMTGRVLGDITDAEGRYIHDSPSREATPERGVAELGDVLHGASSTSTPASRRSASVRAASTGSSRARAKPVCTIT